MINRDEKTPLKMDIIASNANIQQELSNVIQKNIE